jgi:phosphoglucosamine mutase
MEQMLFGTDGIRGIANEGVLSAGSVRRLGAIIGAIARGKTASVACVGRDTRPSGELLGEALMEGLRSAGLDTYDIGILPTPAVAYLVREYECQVGLVVSASHNSAEYNGIKVLAPTGEKIPDEWEAEIQKQYETGESPTTTRRLGRAVPVPEAADRYIELLRELAPDLDLSGMTVAVDCADGAMSPVAPRLLREMGAAVHVSRDSLDGKDINDGCGALHPEALQAFCKGVAVDVGLSFDGDGDRLILVDDRGEIRDGDHVLAISARDLTRRGALTGNTVVGTVMSNVGLERSLGEIGARLLRAPVGDRYVLQEMLQGDYALGGEPSGHTIFLRLSRAGDGLITALQILRTIRERGVPLSGLSEVLWKAPQVLRNIPVASKVPLEEMEEVQEKIREAESRLGESGRVLVRYSGTEPKVRIMVEGPSEREIGHLADGIASAFEGAS